MNTNIYHKSSLSLSLSLSLAYINIYNIQVNKYVNIYKIVTIVSVRLKHYTRFDTICLWRFCLNAGRLQVVRKVIGNAFQIWVPEYWKLFLNNSVLCLGIAILLLSTERKL